MSVVLGRRRRLIASAALLAGCGRIDFLPVGDGGDQSIDTTMDPCAAMVGGEVGAWTLDVADIVGTSVRDRSGFGHDGVVMGTMPVPTTGRIGEALDFAGTTLSYIDLPSVPLDGTPGNFTTISLWMRTDNANVDEALACLPTGPVAGPPRYSMWLTKRAASLFLCINTGEGDCWGLEVSNVLGRWVHLVGVYANGPTIGGQLYLDGVAAAMSCAFGVCDNTRVAQAPFSIACSDPTYAWHGSLDDVRIYNRALTAAEVAQLYRCAP